MILRTPIKF